MRSFILYAFPNIIWVIKLKRIRWVRLAAQAGEKRNEYMGFWGENFKGREDSGIDGGSIKCGKCLE